MTDYAEIFRQHCRPLKLRPTGETERLRRLDGVRGVLFDVYGTMFISGTGDVGTSQQAGKSDAWEAAIAAVGLTARCEGAVGVERLIATIRQHQAQSHADGTEFPEVDIIEVWRASLAQLAAERRMAGELEAVDWRRLACEYEVRTNPVWPMPGLLVTIAALRQRDLTLGLISNAQFYTLPMFTGLLGRPADEFGFDPSLQFFSYRYRQAKPGIFLYESARNALAKKGFATENMLYVGNDMLNDIVPASRSGFRTALFAGDGRSLRWRTGDPRVAGVSPDIVLTDLRSLLDCLAAPGR